MSPLLSQDGVSTKAKHRDQQDVQYEDGDRTAANGATRVMDWEQESESRDRRLCHSQQHRIPGAEEKLGKGSRGHMCLWTCLSGTSVSPPHPCIQSPVLTGTRREGLSVIQGQGGSQPPSPGARLLLAPCPVLQRAEANRVCLDKQSSAWVGQDHHSNAHQVPPQVPHTVSSATALHTGELCFSVTTAHSTPCVP